ncbi:hypothetical protein As57867_004282, partial [Aphanomyces stellatus]
MTREDADVEVDKMTVVMHEKCMPGSVHDFTPEFKTMWHVDEAEPSFALLQGIQTGENPIRIDGWEALLAKYFGCE